MVGDWIEKCHTVYRFAVTTGIRQCAVMAARSYVMVIYQPRRDDLRTCGVTRSEMRTRLSPVEKVPEKMQSYPGIPVALNHCG